LPLLLLMMEAIAFCETEKRICATGYYEYKGEVCLEDGKLQVKYARCKQSRACLERIDRPNTISRSTGTHTQFPSTLKSMGLHIKGPSGDRTVFLMCATHVRTGR